MKQDAKRFSSLIFALLFVAIAFVIYFDFAAPEYQNLQNAKGKELSQAVFIQNEQKVIAQVQTLLQSYKDDTAGEQAVNSALPVGANQATAIAQVYGLAVVNGISIQSLGISATKAPQTTAPNPNIANAANGASIVKPYSTLTFQVAALGSYEGMKGFIQGIEDNIRIFDVKSVSVHANSSSGKASSDFFLYDLTITAYFENS